MQSKFKEFSEYLRHGLSPIPLVVGKKRPIESTWQEFCSKQPDEELTEGWAEKYDLNHIGLCLGTEVKPEHYLVAIDVDDDDLIEHVWNAIGDRNAPAKIGKKGITIFCVAGSDVINQKIKRRTKDGKPERLPSVEILCHGSQTVVPPSIHPQTEKPYKWTTRNLTDGFPDNLPLLDEWVVDEIAAICQRKGDKIVELNEMVWLGPDKGGNTHDSSVEAVAWMVSRGWPDQKIHARIERAKEEACLRNGDKYHWPGSTKAIQEWIDSAREKGMTNSSNKKKRPKERIMAEWAIDELGGFENVAAVNGILRHYKGGYWPEINLPWLKRRMFEEDDTLRKSDVENAMHIIHTLCDREHFGYTAGINPKFDPKRKRICLLNGTLNISTMELEKHDRDHELMFQADFEWDDEAECPNYNKFMIESLGGDKDLINLMDEYAGLTLVPDMSFQKFLIMKGPGGNGKGTWLRLLASVHDPAAISSISITDLNDERKRTSLVGKLLNYSGEQSRLNQVADAYLKKITGQDPIDVRILYGETQNNVYLTVRFIENVNDMPQTSDNSDALRRRMLIAPWLFKPKTEDPDLIKKLMEERPGILRRWVVALNRLYKRGHFVEPEASTQEVDDYMLSQNPVKMWVVERCDEVQDGDLGTPSNDLYGDFREWAEANGYRNPFTNVFWGQKMTALGYPSTVQRLGGGSVRVRRVKIKAGYNSPI